MTTTHDELAYAVAVESVAAIRSGSPPWNAVLSNACHVTSSRHWPVPDFVLIDERDGVSLAAEFKPPGQPKREYLTGLGQALAYTRDFDYGLLIVPDIADDGYRIADHVCSVLNQDDYAGAPIAVIRYDPGGITSAHGGSTVARFFERRGKRPEHRAPVDSSFYAKWREMSPEEAARFLLHLYHEQTEPTSETGTIRDRAWKLTWEDIQAGRLHNWEGRVRHYRTSYVGNMKNWRNFLTHIGWIENDGALTIAGLKAHHVALTYGPKSQIFENVIARSVLLDGKHLILLNSVNEYQEAVLSGKGRFRNEVEWLKGLETHLEERGLLKRNPRRHEVSTRGQTRGFLKAEKQLWKELGFVIPAGSRVYHEGRGFVLDWARITELLKSGLTG